MMLMACGGGGGGGGTAAAPTTPTPMTMMPPGTDDPMTPPGTGDPNTPDPMTPPTVMLEALPDWEIASLAMSRTRIGGTAPTSMTETEIITAIQTRATAADTLRYGDVVQGGAAGFLTDIGSSCSGETCTANIPSIGTLTFSLNDIEDLSLIDDTANLVGFNSDTRAVMVDNEITFAESRAAARQEDGTKLTFQSYGGWLTGSAFGVGYLNVTEGATTTNRFTSFSFGKASGSNPTGTGRAEWTGSAIGIETGNGRLWQGDVTVDIDDLSSRSPNVDVSITDFRLHDELTSSPFSLSWNDMPLTGGVFQHSSGEVNVRGSFYGDNYEGVGGAFDNNDFVGSFAGTKQ